VKELDCSNRFLDPEAFLPQELPLLQQPMEASTL
jgi:hypothetical protein